MFDWRMVARHGWVHAAHYARGRLAGRARHWAGLRSGASGVQAADGSRRLEALDEEALKPRWRGGQEPELLTRRRSDPGKLAIAARLRSETTLPIKRIAARLQTGTPKGAKSVLPHLAQSHDQRQAASPLEPCAQLEFQSTV